MIIVVACVVAHFVDKAFYTFKFSSKDASRSITYFVFIFKICLLIMTVFVFTRLRQVVNREPLLKLNKNMWLIHVVALVFYFVWWGAYEIAL